MEVIVIQIGQILFGRYRIEKLLGTGAYGDVYLAEHLNLHTYRAVKCIRKCHDHCNHAMREADILKTLRHPAIPIIYDIESTEDCVCIIEEYMMGSSLFSLLNTQNCISVRRAMELIMELCDVVAYLHDMGIYHHDLKPQNILLHNHSIRLLDYGSAVFAKDQNTLHMGTSYYAAPEMYGSTDVGAGGDVYSLGVILLLLLTGSLNLTDLEKIHPQSLRTVVVKCLAHDDQERIESVQEFKRLLLQVVNHKNISDVPLQIHFVGLHPHAGTTHCAILATRIWSKNGERTLLKEVNESGDFHTLIHTAEKVSFQRGIFLMGGIRLLPNYHNCMNADVVEHSTWNVCDYGSLTDENFEEILQGDQIYLVTGVAPYELAAFWQSQESLVGRLLQEAKARHRPVTVLVNHADGKTFKKAVRRYGIPNPVRVPYTPNPFSANLHGKGMIFCELGKISTRHNQR